MKWTVIRRLAIAILALTSILMVATVYRLLVAPSGLLVVCFVAQIVLFAVQCEILRISGRYLR